MHSLLKYSILAALVQGGYIVTLKSNSRGNVTQAHLDKVRSLFTSDLRSTGNEIQHVYDTVFHGYSAELSAAIVAQVKAMPEVESVEEDVVGSFDETQSNAPWGLGRISSGSKLPDTQNRFPYVYDPSGGAGIDVFVIDSGVNTNHVEFEGRARWGINLVKGSPNIDDVGHGSHVAGIIAGKTVGVAKKATIVVIKAGGKTGPLLASYLVAGVEWAVKNKNPARGCVINLSVGLPKSDALNRAARAAVNAGCAAVSSAGNNNQDACQQSPASEPAVIAVGATNIQDSRSSFSNWGSCVSVFAPGENIISVGKDGTESGAVMSGTSQASPHVAGLVAYLMARTGRKEPSYIYPLIKSIAKKNVLSNIGNNSPNVLISNIGYQ